MRNLALLILVVLMGCANEPRKNQLKNLNGYWEIEKVILPDGSEKEYTLNPVIDYFQIENMIGYRKKVQPLFDGTFDTSDDAQTFVIVQNGTRFELHYKSNLSEWSETLVSLNETRLVLGTSKGLAYHYKKFESLTLDEE